MIVRAKLHNWLHENYTNSWMYSWSSQTNKRFQTLQNYNAIGVPQSWQRPGGVGYADDQSRSAGDAFSLLQWPSIYTPSYDGLYGRGPTWKQQQNLDRLWEQHRVKLLSRSFLIEQLCQWSIDNNIPMSKATWDGDMEVSPPWRVWGLRF